MPEIILCPECQRRLQLPDDFQGAAVRCPSCRAQFTAASARPAAPTAVAPAPTRGREGPPPPASRRPRLRPLDPPDDLHKKSSRTPCVIVAVVLGVVGLAAMAGIAGIGLLVWKGQSRPTFAAPTPEDSEERLEDVRRAFADQKPLAPEEIKRELIPLFDGLGGALRAADADGISAHFDFERMVDEFVGAAAFPLRTRRDKSNFVSDLRQRIGRSMAMRSELMQWTTTEIRHVKKLNNDEAVIIARHKHPNGALLKMRWWVTRRTGAWKVYDIEDLEVGTRASTSGAALVQQGRGNLSETSRATKIIIDALQDVAARQDADGAERKLEQIAHVKLPRQMEALRFLAKGTIRLSRGQAKEGLDELERAGQFQPDMPVLDFLKGIALNRLGKWAESLKHLEAYRNLLGEDGEICRELGEALRGLGRFPEAARAYRKSLDFNPKDADAFQGFLRSLGGGDDKADVGMRFAKLDSLRENFEIFAADCEEREFPELLEPLALAMRRIDPNFPPVDYYLSLAKARTRHPDQAVPLFKSALAKEPDANKRRQYAERFLRAMASAGAVTAAYAAVPDSRDAFRVLAAETVKRYQTEQLKQLTAAHRKKHADDPLLPLYEAEIYVREGRYALADKTFAEALAKPPDADTLKSFRASRVLARYYTGQALSAYRDIGPRQETFLQLALLCFHKEDNATLQALLDAHAKNDPGSADVLRFRFRLKIRQGQVPEGIALFQSALAKRLSDQKRTELVSEFLGDLVEAGKPLEGYRAAPDAQRAFQIVAEELLEQDRPDDLRQLLDAHRARHPADPWLAYYQGEVHLGEEAWDKAARVLGEGMKKAPKDVRVRFRSRFVFAMYKAGRSLQAYAEAEPRKDTFSQLAELLASDKKATELESLLAAHRPHAGEDPDLFFYEARVKALLKRPAEAAALLQKANQKQPLDFRRNWYASRVLLDMEEAGQGLEGYRAASDKSAAFETLAGRLVFRKKEKELAALLQEHGKGRPQDPLLAFYTGELDLLRGNAKQAAEHFAAALAKARPQEQWRFRNGLFRARVKAGQAADAYRQAEPGTNTFESLAHLCIQEKDAGQLEALIAAHRKAKPDDANITAWELDVRWLKKDYEGALKLLAEHRDGIFASPRFRWKADDYRVRCLVRLKRTKDAIREAEAVMKTQSGNRLLLVLARASAGDVPQTIAALGKGRPQSYLLRNCYQDEDLGPILRGEPFRAFRDRFPEPKDKPARPDRDWD